MNIKEILGIRELFQLREIIKDVIFDNAKRKEYFDEIINNGVDLNTDFLRDLFQEEASARKSFKQDYTPESICELFSRIIGECELIYDECAGTGSLSISCINKGTRNIIAIELSESVLPLLLFNLSIRNISGYVIQGDVTTNEIMNIYKLVRDERYSIVEKVETYENIKYKRIISNPPYSLTWSGIIDERFIGFEIPPKSKADYLFVLDIINKLEDGGNAFILLPHGILFRGNQEAAIRKELVDRGYLKGLIGLPDNMFLNTGIPTVLIHVRKYEDDDKSIFIMDASKLGTKIGKQNILTEEAITKIVDRFYNKTEEEKLCRIVKYEEIQKNDYNLNIPRYIDTFEREQIPEIKDIVQDIISIDREIKDTEKRIAESMKEIVGGNYQSDIKEVIKLWEH